MDLIAFLFSSKAWVLWVVLWWNDGDYQVHSIHWNRNACLAMAYDTDGGYCLILEDGTKLLPKKRGPRLRDVLKTLDGNVTSR